MSHSTTAEVNSGPVTVPATGPAGRTAADRRGTQRSGRVKKWLRKHRGLTVAGAVLLVALGITIANVLAAPKDGRALSAGNPGPTGAQAAARILSAHGVRVEPVNDFASAMAALSSRPGATLFLYDNGSYLDGGQLQQLTARTGHTVVVAPSFTTLEGLDSGLQQAGVVPDGGEVLQPGCSDADAGAAGPIRAPSAYLYSGGVTCYPPGTDGTGTIGVVARSAAGNLTVIGSEQLMSNKELAREGNAALAIRTLGKSDTVVWYLPGVADFNNDASPPALNELAPAWTAYLGPWLILVAALAMVWRGRRMGPLVFEPLPVVVKAGETAYGRARLYQDARAVELARNNLRAGALVRLARHLRLGPDASADDVGRRAAAYVGWPESSVLDLLAEMPAGEARLVQWAQELHKLEQEAAKR